MTPDRLFNRRASRRLVLISLLTLGAAFATALGQGGTSVPPLTSKLSVCEESFPPRPPPPPP